MTYRPEEEVPAIEDGKVSVEEEEVAVPADDVVSSSETVPSPPPPLQNNFDTGDLLVSLLFQILIFQVVSPVFFTFFISWLQGLNDTVPDASLIEERNALALAIVPSENG